VILLILFPSAAAAAAFAAGEAAGAAAATAATMAGHLETQGAHHGASGGRLPSLAALAGGLDADTAAVRTWASAASRASARRGERVHRRDSGYEGADWSDGSRDGSRVGSSDGSSSSSSSSDGSRDGVQGGGGGSTFGLPLP